MVVSKWLSVGLGVLFSFASYQQVSAQQQPSASEVKNSRFETVDSVFQNLQSSFTVDYVSRLEDTFGVGGRETTMDRLNNLFTDVYDSFELHESRSQDEALDFFSTVDSLFEEHGMHNTEGRYINEKLSAPTDGIACFHRTLVFNTLGKVYPFSIRPVIASDDHIFVRYESPSLDTVINWETTSGESFPDSHYIDKYSLSEQAISNGSYLRSLDDSEALATIFRYMAATIRDESGDPDEILSFTKKAYVLDTTRLASLYSVAVAHKINEEYDSAYYYLDKAHSLDSTKTNTWFVRGIVAEDERDLDKAARFYDEALDLDSAHSPSLYRKASIALDQDDVDTYRLHLDRLKENDMSNLHFIFHLEKKFDGQQ
ncbi:MAG: tetratricopeptide repeat protein [Nanobdellota archaeon]